MNYCDQNGCRDRTRVLVEPHMQQTQETQAVTQNVTEASVQSPELKQMWDEFGHTKRQRGKLSSRTAILVSEVDAKLAAENPALHELFVAGRYGAPELKDHYAQIQGMIQEGASTYDKIQHLEAHGALPPAQSTSADATDANALKQEIRRLDDLIHKTNKKINSVPLSGKKSSRNAEWKEKVALAEAMRDDLKEKLKRMKHDARAQRAGTE